MFKNHHKPFVIYADFEVITEKLQSCKPNNESFTEAYQNHKDCSYGYKVVCCYDDKYTKPAQSYRGENAVYKFIEKKLCEVNYCKKVMKNNFNKPLKMTDEGEQHFKKASKCLILQDIRARDHCHEQGNSEDLVIKIVYGFHIR